MAQQMTREEYTSFLQEGSRTAKVATAAKNGQPHVVPVWFVLDGDTIVFTMGDTSAKARHIARDPRIALCVDDERPPFSFVMVEGTAQTSPNPPEMLAWATRIAARYMGADLADAYGRRHPVGRGLLVRAEPTRATGVRARAD